MADFVDQVRKDIDARLRELRPLVEEYHRLEAAAAALGDVPATPSTTATKRRAPSRPISTSRQASGAGTRPRGRPKASGTRGAEALALVRSNPGISIPEIAAKMGIKQNYLYRVLPALADNGLVRKEGRGWHPAEPAAADTADAGRTAKTEQA